MILIKRTWAFALLFPFVSLGQDFGFRTSELTNPKNIQKYYRTLRSYRKKICSNGVEKKYQSLFKAYKGDGFYTPFLNGEIDKKSIKKNYSLILKKQKWINSKIERLDKYIRLPKIDGEIKKIEELIDESLKLKYQFDVKGDRSKEIINKGKKNYKKLGYAFSKLANKIFYLLSFSYPVDHAKNRFAHTLAKRSEDKGVENDIFFRRKIYEDGAPAPSRHGDDAFYRTAIDTIRVELNKREVFISDHLRYDLEWLFSVLPNLRAKGLQYYKTALRNWRSHINDEVKFYSQITKKNLKNRNFASEKLNASSEIKSFIAKKSAESYKYWSKKSDLFQALFAVDTILFNEVGSIDPSGLERKEVVKVILNRYLSPKYNQLKKEQGLVKELSSLKTSKYKWLNVLFSEGEFSFTYYFLPAVTNIYCPSFSKWGRQLRKENLLIGARVLRGYETEEDGKALRYFSRASMKGRIDMSHIWSNYTALPEKLGEEIEGGTSSKLTQSILEKDFRYLYSFERTSETFRVLEVGGRKVVMSSSGKRFYTYRDPHLFRYFAYRN